MFGGNWLSVDRLDLRQFTAASILTKDKLEVPRNYVEAWVSEIVALGADDSTLTCSCGLQSGETGYVDYWLSIIELETQKMSLLTKLEAISY